jgi:hypothetical protein
LLQILATTDAARTLVGTRAPNHFPNVDDLVDCQITTKLDAVYKRAAQGVAQPRGMPRM